MSKQTKRTDKELLVIWSEGSGHSKYPGVNSHKYKLTDEEWVRLNKLVNELEIKEHAQRMADFEAAQDQRKRDEYARKMELARCKPVAKLYMNNPESKVVGVRIERPPNCPGLLKKYWIEVRDIGANDGEKQGQSIPIEKLPWANSFRVIKEKFDIVVVGSTEAGERVYSVPITLDYSASAQEEKEVERTDPPGTETVVREVGKVKHDMGLGTYHQLEGMLGNAFGRYPGIDMFRGVGKLSSVKLNSPLGHPLEVSGLFHLDVNTVRLHLCSHLYTAEKIFPDIIIIHTDRETLKFSSPHDWTDRKIGPSMDYTRSGGGGALLVGDRVEIALFWEQEKITEKDIVRICPHCGGDLPINF